MIRILNTFLLLTFYWATTAQPKICGSNPAMTSFCKDACIICDIDGFTGRNNSNIVGQAPSDFCTSAVNHMQWIGFIAGSVDLDLEVYVHNCQFDNGLEIGLYYSDNCIHFQKISECDTDVSDGDRRRFKNTVPLVIGQYYYLVMDGSSNDVCDYTITVKSGTTKILPLTTAPDIVVPSEICINTKIHFTSPGLTGASEYYWSVNGTIIGSGLDLIYSFPTSGEYLVCFEAFNICDKAPQACKTIKVLPDAMYEFNTQVCFGECFTYENENYCNSGSYERLLTAANGCDSIVRFNLTILDQITQAVDLTICEGESLMIGDTSITIAGSYKIKIKNVNGCFNFVDLNLKTIECEILPTVTVKNITCFDAKNGEISIQVNQATPPLTYELTHVQNSNFKLTGMITSTTQVVKFSNLNEGDYQIKIKDNFGNDWANVYPVKQPTPLVTTAVASTYNGYNIKCRGDKNGIITIDVTSGSAPFIYKIGTTPVTSPISGLAAGKYTVTIVDKNGCQQETTIVLKEPDSLESSFAFDSTVCDHIQTGKIRLISTNGGTPAYTYKFQNKVVDLLNTPLIGLIPGDYTIITQDTNGCQHEFNGKIIEKLIPKVTLTKDYTINLGDTLQLTVVVDPVDSKIIWTSDYPFTCDTCTTTKYRPFQSSAAKVIATSPAGCVTEVLVNVIVNKTRSFIISNVINVVSQVGNKEITYYAGDDVLSVVKYEVYDRWGNMVYFSENLPVGAMSTGFNGLFKHNLLSTGEYTYLAEVSYIDGEIVRYSGSILILH